MSHSDFLTWLKENASHLQGYAPDEVARIALVCGFKMSDIAPGYCAWSAASRRKLIFLESEFRTQWTELAMYQKHGETID